jgi:hypothetical protein
MRAADTGYNTSLSYDGIMYQWLIAELLSTVSEVSVNPHDSVPCEQHSECP